MRTSFFLVTCKIFFDKNASKDANSLSETNASIPIIFPIVRWTFTEFVANWSQVGFKLVAN